MAAEGRAPVSLLGAGCKDVDGRDKRGRDTWGACVSLFAAWYDLPAIRALLATSTPTRNRHVNRNPCLDGNRYAAATSGAFSIDGRCLGRRLGCPFSVTAVRITSTGTTDRVRRA
jgi:hypothetical protein